MTEINVSFDEDVKLDSVDLTEFKALPAGSIYTIVREWEGDEEPRHRLSVLTDDPTKSVGDFFQSSTPLWTYYRKPATLRWSGNCSSRNRPEVPEFAIRSWCRPSGFSYVNAGIHVPWNRVEDAVKMGWRK